MASSSSYAQVSYLGVYTGWIKGNRKLHGASTIPIEVLSTGLRFSEVLSNFEFELVDAEKTCDDKLLKLFTKIMPDKGEKGFNKVVEILTENKNIELAKDLIGGLNRECSTNLTFPVQNTRILQAQAHLSRLIKKNVDFMSKYWSDVIRVAKTEAAFVQVQVLEHFKSENGNPVGSYPEVFDEDGKSIHERILIQADPGCGKTTYVNKLALDWANEDGYLREKFDFVFLIPLQTLTMDVLDAIKCFLPDESEQFFASYAKNCDAKILLILDGFDELVESSRWYSSVMGILNGQSKQFQFFHIIVTTRRSHVEKIPQLFRERSLLIKGFDEESMKQFLGKQHVPLPSVGQESNLSHLLQTPLFCAIYCSLHCGGGEPIEFEDSYDLIKALVENSVKNTLKKKTVANEEVQLDEIGKFAFQMLDSASLNFLKMFCRSSEVIKPLFALSKVNLDLIKKKTVANEEVQLDEIGKFAFQMLDSASMNFVEEQLDEIGIASQMHDSAFLNFLKMFESSESESKSESESESDSDSEIEYKSESESEVIKPLFDLSRVNLDLLIKRTIPTRGVGGCKEEFSLPHQLIAEYLAARYFARSLTEQQLKHAKVSVFFSEIYVLLPALNLPFVQFFLFELLFLYLEKKYDESVFDNFINCPEVRFIWNIKSNKDTPSLDNVHHLNFRGLNSELTNVSRFIPTLSKCRHLSLLKLLRLSKNQVEQLVNFINKNCFQKLTQLRLSGNANVGSTPQLFTALSKCKHLQVLHLQVCEMTVESTTELARCIDNNGLAYLTLLGLGGNENVGSSTDLFHVLHKCRQLQMLYLRSCSMTQESLNIFLSTFNSNTFQQLDDIRLVGNKEIKVDDNFFIALEKCPKISQVVLSKSMKSYLSKVGRKAKETLKQRGCQFIFSL